MQYDIFFPEPVHVGLLRGESVREFEMEMKKEQIRLITLGDMGVGCHGPLSASSDDIVRNTKKILRFAQHLVANEA